MFHFVAVSALAALAVLAPSPVPSSSPNTHPEKNLVEVAKDAGSFNTLLAAVKAAGLEETLASGGPFTVFAPTDEAFARIPKAQLDALLQDKEALTAVLTYHLVSGRVYAKDVVNLASAPTLNGKSLPVLARDGKVQVGDATVVAVDVEATNGVIHVIDRVLLPSR